MPRERTRYCISPFGGATEPRGEPSRAGLERSRHSGQVVSTEAA